MTLVNNNLKKQKSDYRKIILVALAGFAAVFVMIIAGQSSSPFSALVISLLIITDVILLYGIVSQGRKNQKIIEKLEDLVKSQGGKVNEESPVSVNLEKERKRVVPRMQESEFVNITAKKNLVARKPGSGSPVSDIPGRSNHTDSVLSEMLRNAVKNNLIDLFAQPVVALPSRQVKFYELFGRVRVNSGAYIPAGRYIETANNDGLTSNLDNLTLLQCLEYLGSPLAAKSKVGYFINIGTETLKNREFLNGLLGFVSTNRDLAGRLIFEVRQKDIGAVPENEQKILQSLARLGCRFSMDHVSKGQIDAAWMKKNHIEFIKLDVGYLLEEISGSGGAERIKQLISKLKSFNITVIAEKIETMQDLRELLDCELDYGQGYLFGKPDHFSEQARGKVNDNVTGRRTKQQAGVSSGNR